MYSACKNRGTAWDVLKFATSEEQDGAFLEASGQMPMRTDLPATYPEYFAKHPEYKTFADQASRIVEVPNVANSVTIWQTFRDLYSKAVIFGKAAPHDALAGAAIKIDSLAHGS
jgi:multiple sugar transport system substrate-binding protein